MDPLAVGVGVGTSTYLVQPPVRVHRLRVGLVLDAVQVFVEAVQQEGHELLGVVLRVARELAGFAGHDCLGRDRETRLSTLCLCLRLVSGAVRRGFPTLSLDGWKA